MQLGVMMTKSKPNLIFIFNFLLSSKVPLKNEEDRIILHNGFIPSFKPKNIYISIKKKLGLIQSSSFLTKYSWLFKPLGLFVFGFIIRLTIQHFFNVNVSLDLFNLVSICYWFIWAIIINILNTNVKRFSFNF